MADDFKTCCTVESPSRLILFYPEATPSPVTSLLPSVPVCKLVGQQMVLGRSSSADVRLNDDRMSRAYAAVWHDGKDPFIFRVSNISERKMLMVDGVLLRYKEEAEVKDGSVLVLDFLEFKAKVCAGDVIACNYQVCFAKNLSLSPVSSKPADGKGLFSLLPDERNSSICCSTNGGRLVGRSLDKTEPKIHPLLSCIRTGSLDSGMGSGMVTPGMAGAARVNPPAADYHPIRSYSLCESNWGEYGLPESVDKPVLLPGCSQGGMDGSARSTLITPSANDKKLSLNIPVQTSSPPDHFMAPTSTTTPEQLKQNLCYVPPLCGPMSQPSAQPPSPKKNVSCWFNIGPDPQPQKMTPDVQDLGDWMEKKLVVSNPKVCPSCRGCGEGTAARQPAAVETGPAPRQQTLTLPDMIPGKGGERNRSPVENSEWDTDDPNINSYMG